MDKKKDSRSDNNIILAMVCIVIASYLGYKNIWGLSVLFQSLGICAYVAWLFIQRD